MDPSSSRQERYPHAYRPELAPTSSFTGRSVSGDSLHPDRPVARHARPEATHAFHRQHGSEEDEYDYEGEEEGEENGREEEDEEEERDALDVDTSQAEQPPPRKKRTFKKRSHAKRTCQRCQKLKTRCVLPNVNVYSSPSPLPPSLSCDKCSKQQRPCIVNDRRGPRAPPPGYIASNLNGSYAMRAVPSESSQHQPAHLFADTVRTSFFTDEGDRIWHGPPDQPGHEPPGPAGPSTHAPPPNGDHDDPRKFIATSTSVFAAVRPLFLLSTLVNAVITQSPSDFHSQVGSPACTFIWHAPPPDHVREIIEQRYEVLLVWAAHLPSFQLVQSRAFDPDTTSPENRFLATTAFWISLAGSTSEPNPEHCRLLKADVVAGAMSALVAHPRSVDVVHALVLLATHSMLEFELVSTSTSDHLPGRGFLAAARQIAVDLNLPLALSSLVRGSAPILNWDERVERLSQATLWITICIQEAHMVLSRESLINAPLDQLFDIDETELVAFEREAWSLLHNRASSHVALSYRVRTFKHLHRLVKSLYAIEHPFRTYSELTDGLDELFRDFDDLRLAKEMSFSHFNGPLADKLATWVQIEMDGIESCMAQRFSLYASIGSFYPHPEIDTRQLLRDISTDPTKRAFLHRIYQRASGSMSKCLSALAGMSAFIHALPGPVTLSLVVRVAKIFLEHSTAEMVGFKNPPSNVDTLELLISSAARAMGDSLARSTSTEGGGGGETMTPLTQQSGGMLALGPPPSSQHHYHRSASQEGRRMERGGPRWRPGSLSANEYGSSRASETPHHVVSPNSTSSPAPSALTSTSKDASANVAAAMAPAPASAPPPTSAPEPRTYAFSPGRPCGSAESVPLIVQYLLSEMAITLHRRAKMCRRLYAQERAHAHAHAQDQVQGLGGGGGGGRGAGPTLPPLSALLDGGWRRYDVGVAAGPSSASASTSSSSRAAKEEGAYASAGSTSGYGAGNCNVFADSFSGAASGGGAGPGGGGGGPMMAGVGSRDGAVPGSTGSGGDPVPLFDSMLPTSWIDTIFQAGGILL